MKDPVDQILESSEPSVRYKARVQLLSEDPESKGLKTLQDQVRRSERTRMLLSERGTDGRIPRHPYSKWDGAHWVLSSLAESCYPQGDRTLEPLLDQVYAWLLPKEHEEHTTSRLFRHRISPAQVELAKLRPRIHASMEGNALWYAHRLGIADGRTEKLLERLLRTQWPDGGWNCDGDPRAMKSSFMESLLPLRALALHARETGDSKAGSAAKRAAEVFLKRRMFRRMKNGAVMDADFTRLHYPCYWHYDILFGLSVMCEAGFIKDPRCSDAIDLLETKRLPGGGYPAESKYYKGKNAKAGRSLVGWGPVGSTRLNEFVTVDALCVLKEAGRLRL